VLYRLSYPALLSRVGESTKVAGVESIQKLRGSSLKRVGLCASIGSDNHRRFDT